MRGQNFVISLTNDDCDDFHDDARFIIATHYWFYYFLLSDHFMKIHIPCLFIYVVKLGVLTERNYVLIVLFQRGPKAYRRSFALRGTAFGVIWDA